jgi:hypothetical protein
MGEKISLHIFRRLDNRLQGDWADTSPLALELHNRRKAALEEILDDPALRVEDWGYTKDSESHELVQLTIEVLSSPAMAAFAGAALTWLGQRISGAIGSATEDGIKALVQRLLRAQKQEQVLDYTIFGPDGNALVTVTPSTGDSSPRPISIEIATGSEVVTVGLDEIPT